MKDLFSSLKKIIFLSFILLIIFAGEGSGCGNESKSPLPSSNSGQGNSSRKQSKFPNSELKTSSEGTVETKVGTVQNSSQEGDNPLSTQSNESKSPLPFSNSGQGNSSRKQSKFPNSELEISSEGTVETKVGTVQNSSQEGDNPLSTQSSEGTKIFEVEDDESSSIQSEKELPSHNEVNINLGLVKDPEDADGWINKRLEYFQECGPNFLQDIGEAKIKFSIQVIIEKMQKWVEDLMKAENNNNDVDAFRVFHGFYVMLFEDINDILQKRHKKKETTAEAGLFNFNNLKGFLFKKNSKNDDSELTNEVSENLRKKINNRLKKEYQIKETTTKINVLVNELKDKIMEFKGMNKNDKSELSNNDFAQNSMLGNWINDQFKETSKNDKLELSNNGFFQEDFSYSDESTSIVMLKNEIDYQWKVYLLDSNFLPSANKEILIKAILEKMKELADPYIEWEKKGLSEKARYEFFVDLFCSVNNWLYNKNSESNSKNLINDVKKISNEIYLNGDQTVEAPTTIDDLVSELENDIETFFSEDDFVSKLENDVETFLSEKESLEKWIVELWKKHYPIGESLEEMTLALPENTNKKLLIEVMLECMKNFAEDSIYFGFFVELFNKVNESEILYKNNQEDLINDVRSVVKEIYPRLEQIGEDLSTIDDLLREIRDKWNSQENDEGQSEE